MDRSEASNHARGVTVNLEFSITRAVENENAFRPVLEAPTKMLGHA